MKLVANAVPVQLAEAIGRVILERNLADSIPAVQGNFSSWLKQRGQTNQVARNTKTQLTKARRILGGRTFRDVRHEILALEERPSFDALDRKVKSNLRAAVRLYAEFLDSSIQRAKLEKLALAARFEIIGISIPIMTCLKVSWIEKDCSRSHTHKIVFDLNGL
ncbi:hypothetical protein BKD03_14510 [Brucella sp. 09RB8471]|nr:hypothetical protein BKD03_14510 [Brucella sp. 09RB8471]